jgi:hypothetical protein
MVHWNFSSIYGFRWMLYEVAVQLNLSKLCIHPNQSFGGGSSVFGVVGSIYRRHPMNDANGRYRPHIVHLNQVPQGNDHFWFTRLRSPACNDLTSF